MRIPEKNYEFRKKLYQIHKDSLRKAECLPEFDEIEIADGFYVDISTSYTDVVYTAAKDFAEYMLVSMGVAVCVTVHSAVEACVRIEIDPDSEKLDEGKGYMGYRIDVFEKYVNITAYDERGAAQALYRLEDIMSRRKAPYLKKGSFQSRQMFSPRMVHSGYGIDQFPDCHLRDIAHAGMDAILVYTKGPNLTTCGFVDFNELIYRAAKYGIDVYSYSYLKSEMHPDDDGAEQYYESIYGKLFEKCPGLKGVVLVGESVAFPSHDEHTSGSLNSMGADGIPDGRIHPGWWPCSDYPDWLRLLSKVIRRHNADADIVFWSYNWGWAPAEDRIRLIENLPKDVSLLVTFEMHETYEVNGIKEYTSDYTLSFAGPGRYFLSEAEAAKKAGIRLYAMANTGGLTWDFGTIPYEPFPMQWQKRYDSLKKCYDDYGLCGLMESHHYGFYPSFISELAKMNFAITGEPGERILDDVLYRFFAPDNIDILKDALTKWSEAICFYDAVAADQYGPFRIGPAYPLCFNKRLVPPSAAYAHFGVKILETKYDPFSWYERGLSSIPQMTIHSELDRLNKMSLLMEEGITLIETLKDKNDALCELLDLGKYINCSVKTAINAKKFILARTRLNNAKSISEMECELTRMENIASDEIINAQNAIPLVQYNSRLGWEPSMEYLGDEEHIEWKIRQVRYMLEIELASYRKGLNLDKSV